MRAAFSYLELIFVIFIFAITAYVASPKFNLSLNVAANQLLSHIRYAQHLALNDSLIFNTKNQANLLSRIHPSIDPDKLLNRKQFWQIQFHQTGIYTKNSYSIFFDTPRFSPTTDNDNQPMPGDLIAVSGANKKCLSGYSTDNTPFECRNNTEVSVRLFEAFNINKLDFSGDSYCKEMGTFRILFDEFGKPYCSKNKQALTKIMKITLYKNKDSKSICITPESGYAYFCK